MNSLSGMLIKRLSGMQLKRTLAVCGVAAAMCAVSTIGAYAAESPSQATVAPAAGATAVTAKADDQPRPKIAGGHTVSSAPWAAQVDFGAVCSGTIIAPHWVLTAWHCLRDEEDLSEVTIRVGSVTLKQGGTVAKIKNVQHRSDIALVELDRDVDTTYAKLAPANPPTGTIVDVFGWGESCESGCSQAETLKTATLRVNGVGDPDENGVQLVELAEVSGYTRSGDSGGPAMHNGLQFGVLLGGCCGNNGEPFLAFYSSISSQLAWVEQVTGVKPADATPAMR